MSTSNSGNSEDINNETEAIEVTIPEQKTTAIPLFLKKLWKMVNDPSAETIISWNSTGDGFVIYDQVKFVTELLPQYFKHNNLSSFIRQLNFYDFHKVANIDKHEMEFSHSYFLKDLPETLSFITRKVPNVKFRNTQNLKQENINEVFTGVKELKNKHTLIENELKLLKQENAALWSEINSLRVKYSKQTKVINKLIHFLISYMHSHQNSFTKPNIARKNDQQLLRKPPQLFQIDYFKPSTNNERKTNFKIPSSHRTVTITDPDSVKNSSQNFIQPKIIKNVSNSSNKQKYSLAKMNSYPLERIVTEINPESYNVTSPEQYESRASSSKSEYPIEEIVTEIDPNLEQSSIYTVKFPKGETKCNQNLETSPVAVRSNSTITNKKKKCQSKSKTCESGKLTCDKRKFSDNSPSPLSSQNPKMLKISQRHGKPLKLIIQTPSSNSNVEPIKKNQQKPKQSLLKGKKKLQNITPKDLEKDIAFPQPSPIKPEVILENLFTEIENQPTEQNISGILSDLPSNTDDLGLQLETDPAGVIENQPQVFLFNDQQGNLVQNQEDFEQVSAPTDLLSDLTANPVDPLAVNQEIEDNPPEEMLSLLPTTSLPTCKSEVINDFDEDLENYPDEMLSSLSSNLPQAVSPSRELLKYGIIENPKENLGMYLDNTQIQLNNIQDILNDLNSEELFDLLSCFNADDDDDDNSDQKKIKC